MGIDVDELKRRIADVRGGAKLAVKPRRAHEAAPATRLFGAGLAGRLYAIPVLGYALRIAAAIANFPHILQNLSRHYVSTETEIARLHAQVAELRHQTELAMRAAAVAGQQTADLRKQVDALVSARDAPVAPRKPADRQAVKLPERAPPEKPAHAKKNPTRGTGG